jgi:hypothetical protein
MKVPQLEVAGPLTPVVLQAPSTASSGRKGICFSSGFWYGFFGGGAARFDLSSMRRVSL